MIKIEILPPPKKKYLIFEEQHSNVVKKLISEKKEIEILHTRLEKINLFILLKSLFKFNFRMFDYFQEYINYVEPKFLITILDNSSQFYKFKCDSGKKVVIQNGKRTLLDIFYEFKNNKNSIEYYSDVLFLHNSCVGEEYKKYIKGNVRVIGSIWSNFKKINYKQNLDKNDDLILVSSFRENYINNKGFVFNNIKWAKYIYYEKFFLKCLNNFLIKNNYKLKILTKYGNDTFESEKNYYLKFFNPKKIEIIKNKKRDNFDLIDNASLVIGFESTLIYEAFGRGKKVYFLGLRGKTNLLKSRNFAWPYKPLNKGLFWNNSLNFNSFDEDIKKLINLSSFQWKVLFLKYRNKIMSYDANNKIIKDYLN